MKSFVHYGYKALWIMFIYIFIFGFGIFAFELPKTPTNISFDISALDNPSDTPIYATIIEGNNDALKTRLALIEAATESIDISVYSVSNDYAKSIIQYALLDAADRGVTVRFIIDGFFEGGRYTDDPGLDYISMHDNIEIKYYNEYSLTHTPEVHNRMHDKLLIVDDYYALMSGRNLGDRYFNGQTLFDRDVLIFGTDSQAIQDMSDYFNAVYNYPLSDRYQRDADAAVRETIEAAYNDYLTDNPIDTTLTDLETRAMQVTQAMFIYNPLTAIPKQPVLLETLVDIAKDKDDLLIQSPYFVITKDMKRILDPLKDKNITMLTNSPATNANVPAVGGYLRDRDDLRDIGTIYEYEGAMLHAKSMAFGDDISVIGSFNMDPRSAYLSTESMLIIVSEPFNQDLRFHINALIDDSIRVTDSSPVTEQASLPRRFVIRLTQILFLPFERLL